MFKRRPFFPRMTIRYKKHKYFPKKMKINPYLFLIFSVVLTSFIYILFATRLYPIITIMSQSRAIGLATRAVNEAVTEKLSQDGIDYSNLVIIEKNSDGSISAIKTDIVKINKLKSELIICTEKRIESLNSTEIGIPIGNIFNNEFLSGRGPKIPIKLVPTGYATIDVKNSFTAAGINQTKHEIFLDIKTQIEILLPSGSTIGEVTTQIPVAETIIVGNVPQTYTNVEGITSNPPDAIIDIAK